MSQMDQELLFREVRGMAALPPITDIRLMGRHVRKVPHSEVARTCGFWEIPPTAISHAIPEFI